MLTGGGIILTPCLSSEVISRGIVLILGEDSNSLSFGLSFLPFLLLASTDTFPVACPIWGLLVRDLSSIE